VTGKAVPTVCPAGGGVFAQNVRRQRRTKMPLGNKEAMTTLTPERVKDIRDSVENHITEPGEDWLETINYHDLLAILDDYSALKAEVERLNTWHSTLSEAWKARAEKVERKLVYNENELENTKDRVRKMRAELALGNKAWLIKQKQLEEARAALALREEKNNG
jgi:hypothetical protein